jgi:hypothetical protein
MAHVIEKNSFLHVKLNVYTSDVALSSRVILYLTSRKINIKN